MVFALLWLLTLTSCESNPLVGKWEGIDRLQSTTWTVVINKDGTFKLKYDNKVMRWIMSAEGEYEKVDEHTIALPINEITEQKYNSNSPETMKVHGFIYYLRDDGAISETVSGLSSDYSSVILTKE